MSRGSTFNLRRALLVGAIPALVAGGTHAANIDINANSSGTIPSFSGFASVGDDLQLTQGNASASIIAEIIGNTAGAATTSTADVNIVTTANEVSAAANGSGALMTFAQTGSGQTQAVGLSQRNAISGILASVTTSNLGHDTTGGVTGGSTVAGNNILDAAATGNSGNITMDLNGDVDATPGATAAVVLDTAAAAGSPAVSLTGDILLGSNQENRDSSVTATIGSTSSDGAQVIGLRLDGSGQTVSSHDVTASDNSSTAAAIGNDLNVALTENVSEDDTDTAVGVVQLNKNSTIHAWNSDLRIGLAGMGSGDVVNDSDITVEGNNVQAIAAANRLGLDASVRLDGAGDTAVIRSAQELSGSNLFSVVAATNNATLGIDTQGASLTGDVDLTVARNDVGSTASGNIATQNITAQANINGPLTATVDQHIGDTAGGGVIGIGAATTNVVFGLRDSGPAITANSGDSTAITVSDNTASADVRGNDADQNMGDIINLADTVTLGVFQDSGMNTALSGVGSFLAETTFGITGPVVNGGPGQSSLVVSSNDGRSSATGNTANQNIGDIIHHDSSSPGGFTVNAGVFQANNAIALAYSSDMVYGIGGLSGTLSDSDAVDGSASPVTDSAGPSHDFDYDVQIGFVGQTATADADLDVDASATDTGAATSTAGTFIGFGNVVVSDNTLTTAARGNQAGQSLGDVTDNDGGIHALVAQENNAPIIATASDAVFGIGGVNSVSNITPSATADADAAAGAYANGVLSPPFDPAIAALLASILDVRGAVAASSANGFGDDEATATATALADAEANATADAQVSAGVDIALGDVVVTDNAVDTIARGNQATQTAGAITGNRDDVHFDVIQANDAAVSADTDNMSFGIAGINLDTQINATADATADATAITEADALAVAAEFDFGLFSTPDPVANATAVADSTANATATANASAVANFSLADLVVAGNTVSTSAHGNLGTQIAGGATGNAAGGHVAILLEQDSDAGVEAGASDLSFGVDGLAFNVALSATANAKASAEATAEADATAYVPFNAGTETENETEVATANATADATATAGADVDIGDITVTDNAVVTAARGNEGAQDLGNVTGNDGSFTALLDQDNRGNVTAATEDVNFGTGLVAFDLSVGSLSASASETETENGVTVVSAGTTSENDLGVSFDIGAVTVAGNSVTTLGVGNQGTQLFDATGVQNGLLEVASDQVNDNGVNIDARTGNVDFGTSLGSALLDGNPEDIALALTDDGNSVLTKNVGNNLVRRSGEAAGITNGTIALTATQTNEGGNRVALSKDIDFGLMRGTDDSKYTTNLTVSNNSVQSTVFGNSNDSVLNLAAINSGTVATVNTQSNDDLDLTARVLNVTAGLSETAASSEVLAGSTVTVDGNAVGAKVVANGANRVVDMDGILNTGSSLTIEDQQTNTGVVATADVQDVLLGARVDTAAAVPLNLVASNNTVSSRVVGNALNQELHTGGLLNNGGNVTQVASQTNMGSAFTATTSNVNIGLFSAGAGTGSVAVSGNGITASATGNFASVSNMP